MNAPQSWHSVSYATLEDRGVTLPKRFSASLSLFALFPPEEHVHEMVERERLGSWRVLALSSTNLGYVVVGSPEHEGGEFGARVWAEEGVEPKDLKKFLSEASRATGYDIAEASG